jgi:hypothetical protein
MTEPNHVLDPALAARLPERVRTLLEQRVPFFKDYDKNFGILIGLQFARVLLNAAPSTIEQAREAVAEAVRVTGARLDRMFAGIDPNTSAKWTSAHFTHEMIAEVETHDPDDPTDVSLDDFIEELEKKFGLPPESGAA